MELVKVSIKNYKIHNEVTIDFERGLNLISGNNETGKSTLVDAIHKALFFKASGNSVVHKSLKSKSASGDPTVELEFKVGEQAYTLKKIFASKGETVLRSSKGEVYEDDAAEEALSRLLGEETGVKKSDIKDKWRHLWILQGNSGDLSVEDINAQQNSLFQNLQEDGVSSVILSEVDKQLMKTIEEQVKQVFTDQGKVRTGTRLASLKNDKENIEEKVLEAKTAFSTLLDQSEQLDDTLNAIEVTNNTIAEHEEKLTELEKEFEQIRVLRQSEETAKTKLIHAQETVLKLEKDVTNLANYLHQKKSVQEKINPLKERSQELKETIKRLEKQQTEEEKQIELNEQQKEKLQNKLKLYSSSLDLVEVNTTLQHLEVKQKELEVIAQTIKEEEEHLTSLPPVSKTEYKELETLKREVDKLEAVLTTIATEVSVETSNEAILLNGSQINKDKSVTITKDSTIQIGEGVKIRIKPGGGDALKKQKEALEQAKLRFNAKLTSLGEGDISKVHENLIKREHVLEKIKALKLSYEAKKENGLNEQLNKFKERQVQLNQQIKLLLKQEANADKHLNEVKLREALKHTQEELTQLEDVLKGLGAQKTTLQKQAKLQQKQLESITEELEGLKGQEVESTTRANVILELYKSEEALKDKLNEATLTLKKAEADLNEMTLALHKIDAEGKELDYNRLKRAHAKGKERLEGLQQKKYELQTLLRRDGSIDLNEEIQKNTADLEEITRRFEAERKQMEAIRLLNNLFQEEQATIMSSVIEPFKERIDKYLKIIMGPDVQVVTDTEGSDIRAISLVKRQNGVNEVFSFEALSGGAKEQVANAIRIAMAEVLAADFDGVLPLVLDESFNNTDPERLSRVHRMLDVAQNNGVQLIILTSDYKDYAALGAKESNL